MYDNKAQSRKWLLTINNPLDHGMTHDEIIDRAQKFNPDYFCMADEIGNRVTPQALYRAFKIIVTELEMPMVRFHDLRHSYAVISLKSGDDVKTVQENLGHATAAFTLDVYGHVTEKMKKDSANRMEAFIKSVS